MKQPRIILLSMISLLLILSACSTAANPPASSELATAVPEAMKTVKLYYPNVNDVACYADSTYIEMQVPESEYNAESVLNLLFSHELTEEERAQGFYNNLTWLKFGSIDYVIDEDGSLNYADEVNPVVGLEYLRLTIQDPDYNIKFGVDTPAYLQWSNESATAGSDVKEGGFCWLQIIGGQISNTFYQFYPEYSYAASSYQQTIWNAGDGTSFEMYFRTQPVVLTEN